MKARLRFKGWKEAEADTKKLVMESIQKPAFLEAVGKKALANMKQDLLQGNDPNTRDTHSAGLEKSTIKQREYIAKNNSVSQFYKPNRALMLTGQLVKSLTYTISKSRPMIFFKALGMHVPYKSAKGRSLGKPISNQRLLEIHHLGQGQKKRSLIGISEQGKKSIVAMARRAIAKILSPK